MTRTFRPPIDVRQGCAYKECLSNAVPKSGFKSGSDPAESNLKQGALPANP